MSVLHATGFVLGRCAVLGHGMAVAAGGLAQGLDGHLHGVLQGLALGIFKLQGDGDLAA